MLQRNDALVTQDGQEFLSLSKLLPEGVEITDVLVEADTYEEAFEIYYILLSNCSYISLDGGYVAVGYTPEDDVLNLNLLHTVAAPEPDRDYHSDYDDDDLLYQENDDADLDDQSDDEEDYN